jgi:phosphoglycerate dehydrogenase-like enzyme
MKPSARIINVGRGGIVDEGALDVALREGRLAGAALDVFETEPLPESAPLWETPNLLISPHLAGERSDYREAVAEIWLENIERWIDGRPLRGQVA